MSESLFARWKESGSDIEMTLSSAPDESGVLVSRLLSLLHDHMHDIILLEKILYDRTDDPIVITTRDITEEEARDEIVEFVKDNSGTNAYDIARGLHLPLWDVVRIGKELMNDGSFGAADESDKQQCCLWVKWTDDGEHKDHTLTTDGDIAVGVLLDFIKTGGADRCIDQIEYFQAS